MMSTIEDLKTRRSCRKFKDEQISDEDLKIILETATYAPTGRGDQSPKIVVIQNPDTINPIGIEVSSLLKFLMMLILSTDARHW